MHKRLVVLRGGFQDAPQAVVEIGPLGGQFQGGEKLLLRLVKVAPIEEQFGELQASVHIARRAFHQVGKLLVAGRLVSFAPAIECRLEPRGIPPRFKVGHDLFLALLPPRRLLGQVALERGHRRAAWRSRERRYDQCRELEEGTQLVHGDFGRGAAGGIKALPVPTAGGSMVVVGPGKPKSSTGSNSGSARGTCSGLQGWPSWE